MTEATLDAFATLFTVLTVGAFALLLFGLARARIAYGPRR